MENNLYYTPTIEEFHVGFEYEVMIPEKSIWSKEVFFLNDSHINIIKWVTIQDEFTTHKVRVKYLDQSDIESLGWMYDMTDFNNKFVFLVNQRYKINSMYNLVKYDDQDLITISKKDDNSSYIFKGIIKNKSELIKLMQQLNIK